MTRIRIALVGLGRVAELIHLPALKSVRGIELVGAAEPDAARRTALARQFSIAQTFADAESMLAACKPGLVIVGTPPHTHHDLCLLSLHHGAHVFCEKPFVGSVREADDLIAAADARERLLWINNQYRFMRTYAVPRERIARGEWGRAYFVQCWQQVYHPPAHDQGWRGELKQSTLYEFGTHVLDLICFLFDALPCAVTAHTPRARAEFDADVLVQMTLRFPDERIATLAFNRVSQAPERYLEMRVDCERASLRLSLGGVARASLDWSKASGRPIARVSFVRGGEARVEAGGHSHVIAREPRQAYASATATHLQKCIEAIERGERDNAAARHAREVLRLVFAGYESARTGETVWLAEFEQGD